MLGSLCERSFGPLVSGSYRTTCTRSCIKMLSDRLCQDPLGPLVQDFCIRILWDNLCKISVSGSLCEDPLGHLHQDPVGALVQDLCSRIFWPTVSGSYRCTCARSLYQDPVGPLVSGSCYRILWEHLYKISLLSGSYKTTCARSLYQDPVGPLLSGSRRATSARSLSQDLWDHLHQDLVNEQILRDFLEN